MFQRIRNVVLIVITAIIMCSAIANAAIMQLPNSVLPKKSLLEGRSYETFPEIALGNIATGAFQASFERYTSDMIPCRDAVLLSYSALQRKVIRMANVLFDYNVYPTFFGSKVAYCESDGVLLQYPSEASKKIRDVQLTCADNLNTLVSQHEKVRFFLYAIPHAAFLDDSPVALSMNNSCGYSFFEDNLISRLKGVSIIDSWVSYSEYLSGWARTDHHWSIIGAYEAYRRLASELGYGNTLVGVRERIEYDVPPFYGTFSRTGKIDELSDHVIDYLFDLGDYEVFFDGTEKSANDLVHRDIYIKGLWSQSVFENRYAEYFHTDIGEIELYNNAAESGKTLLLVADSYSNCIERLFTKHYAKVLVYDSRHNTLNLTDYLNAHPEIDDVVFFMYPSSFSLLKF